MSKLGDQYYVAQPNSRVSRDSPLQAFARDTNSVVSEEETNAYAAHSLDKQKTPHQGEALERRGSAHPNFLSHVRSNSEQRPMSSSQVTPMGRQFRDASRNRGGCFLCKSYQQQISFCPHTILVGAATMCNQGDVI